MKYNLIFAKNTLAALNPDKMVDAVIKIIGRTFLVQT